uniref:protein LTV1 homolog n=1 Tax=Myxine glutinosa TaxID=7769 RepID=UPI00358F1C26
MPHKQKKAFIDKKHAVKFHLVHRSQRDPLQADETAPQRVLVQAAKKGDKDKRLKEQRTFGIFFDDDYNYLQHLKELPRTAELLPVKPSHEGAPIPIQSEDDVEIIRILATSFQLPSSVFATDFEEKTGLLNRAAPVRGPRPDWDPDIVAALDDDFDFDAVDSAMEDNFVLKANALHPFADEKDEHDDEWEDMEGSFGSDDLSSEGEGLTDQEHLFMEEETKSRFTAYSMTSAIVPRSEQLVLLDDHFEKFYENYEDDEIGALDHCDLEGHLDICSERVKNVLEQFEVQVQTEHQQLDVVRKELDKTVELNKVKMLEYEFVNDDYDDDDMVDMIIEKPNEKWDCESILSTYSNLYHHPKLIEETPKHKPVRVSAKSGVPLEVFKTPGPTARQVERMQTIGDLDLPRAATQPRPRGECAEDRKMRKQAIRKERQERRMEKKANQQAFKQEKMRQEKVLLNLQQNVQGIRLM